MRFDWRRHRIPVVVGAVALVAALGLGMWYFSPTRRAAELTRAGIAAGKNGDLYQASVLLLQAAKTDPDYFLAHFNLGLALRALDKPEDALQEFYAAAATNPKDAATYFEIGRIHAKAGRGESALAALEHAIDLGFDDIPLLAKDPDLDSVNKQKRFMDLWTRWETRSRRQKPGTPAR